MIRALGWTVLLLLGGSFASVAAEFLPVDDAFKLSSSVNGLQMNVRWEIEPDYYLYQGRMAVTDEKGKPLPFTFSTPSKLKQDPNFGEVEVFYHSAELSLERNALPASADSVMVGYQGCSAKGLCYPPQKRRLSFTIAPDKSRTNNSDVSPDKPAETLYSTHNAGTIANFLADSSMLSILGVFFLLGLGLSLTPCILPMVPILSGIIVGQGSGLSALRGLQLSTSYVFGMALAYALLGVTVAHLGASGNLQIWMQTPWVILLFSALFILLALSMFGIFTLRMPNRLQLAVEQFSRRQRGGMISGVFMMGLLSALVVSPCVSAPLAGALLFISGSGSIVTGGASLFMLGIGMGGPLLLIGAGGGRLLPKAGVWMVQIKIFFGVLLMGMAIWLLSRVLPSPVTLLLWAILLIAYAIHEGALEPASGSGARLKKAVVVMVMGYGFLLFTGALLGNSDPMRPLSIAADKTLQAEEIGNWNVFERVSSKAALQEKLLAAQKAERPVILDFYAKWCTACVEMEEGLFRDEAVQRAISGFALVQLDMTKMTPELSTLLAQFELPGPPAIIFFDKRGEERKNHRLIGEVGQIDFLDFLAHLN